MRKNKELAKLIYGLAQYEGYNTSLVQTQKNLGSQPEERRFERESDRYIFEDLLKAIDYASEQSELTVEVFKGINASMDSQHEGQPEQPGVLRENLPIAVGDYVPPVTVTEKKVQSVLDSVTDKSARGGWALYAKLAKLQAFDNGNKRTALISANLFTGALLDENESLLLIPMDYRRLRFDANLFDFYMADDWDDHVMDTEDALEQFVSFALTVGQ